MENYQVANSNKGGMWYLKSKTHRSISQRLLKRFHSCYRSPYRSIVFNLRVVSHSWLQSPCRCHPVTAPVWIDGMKLYTLVNRALSSVLISRDVNCLISTSLRLSDNAKSPSRRRSNRTPTFRAGSYLNNQVHSQTRVHTQISIVM